MSFVGARFDPGAVRKLLPHGLEPVDEHTGTMCVYSARFGWGIAPYSACFAAIEVKDFDSPDGSSGYYMATGHFSGRAGVVMERDYNRNFSNGKSRHFQDGDLAIGIGGPEGIDALTITTRPSTERPPSTSGIHHYLGRNAVGGTNLYAVAFTGEIWDAEPVSVAVSDAASEKMKLAKPVELLWAFECHDMSLTFSAPRSVDDGAHALAIESTKASLLDVFTRIGRAALLVGKDGEIVVMNKEAETLLGDGLTVRRGVLQVVRPSDQPTVDNVLAAAIERSSNQFDLAPIAFDRTIGTPIIMRAVPVDSATTGKPTALVLLNDPARDDDADPAPTLQLLGLTPSEARIVALVGSGRSPREAAAELDNSEGTVRTALNHIYDKLDINRQSELARIVARLETIGA